MQRNMKNTLKRLMSKYQNLGLSTPVPLQISLPIQIYLRINISLLFQQRESERELWLIHLFQVYKINHSKASLVKSRNKHLNLIPFFAETEEHFCDTTNGFLIDFKYLMNVSYQSFILL